MLSLEKDTRAHARVPQANTPLYPEREVDVSRDPVEQPCAYERTLFLLPPYNLM